MKKLYKRFVEYLRETKALNRAYYKQNKCDFYSSQNIEGKENLHNAGKEVSYKELINDSRSYFMEVTESNDVIDFTYYFGKLISVLDDLIQLDERYHISIYPSPRKEKERILSNLDKTIDRAIDRFFSDVSFCPDAMSQANQIEHILNSIEKNQPFYDLMSQKNIEKVESYRKKRELLISKAYQEYPALKKYEQKARQKEEENWHRLLLITPDEMEKFKMIPFQLNCQIKFVQKRYAYMGFNKANIASLEIEIEKINLYLEQSEQLNIGLPKNIKIPTSKICYDVPTKLNGLKEPRSYIECCPFTKTLKTAKYPVKVFFNTIGEYKEILEDEALGELRYLSDGSIGYAKITRWKNGKPYIFIFKLVGAIFFISKISTFVYTSNGSFEDVLYEFAP